MKYESGISVCITAYKAVEFIRETLDSVAAQTWFKDHDNWEIIVGVDGCRETLEYLKTIKGNYKNLVVLMMNSNRGTYVTSNTIMSTAKYDGLIRFDSDDIMCPDLVSEVMKNRAGADIIRLKVKNFGGNDKELYACGEIYVRHTFFDEFGGYKDWPCGGDSDFLKRTVNYARTVSLDKILIHRRVHQQSLTMSKKTGWKSVVRKKYMGMLKNVRIRRKSDAVIDMRRNTFKELMDDGKLVERKKKPSTRKGRPQGRDWGGFFELV